MSALLLILAALIVHAHALSLDECQTTFNEEFSLALSVDAQCTALDNFDVCVGDLIAGGLVAEC